MGEEKECRKEIVVGIELKDFYASLDVYSWNKKSEKRKKSLLVAFIINVHHWLL